MKTFLRLFACGFAVALQAANAQATTASDRDVEEVKATMVQMWLAIENGDVEKYASFVHPDFTQFGENDTYLAEGKTNEVRGMAEYLKRARIVHTEMHQPQVTIRGNVAWVTYYWTDEGLLDGKRFTSRGKSTRIFVREQGRWLCIHGHYTSVP
jgi:ketosteroid isomerase-like protein